MEENLKQLLLKDLSARLPYGVKCKVDGISQIMPLCAIQVEDAYNILLLFDYKINDLPVEVYLSEVKPYLRPMSSMTEEEMFDFHENGGTLTHYFKYDVDLNSLTVSAIDWLNKHYFDYRDLILISLALEALEDMY